MTVLEETPARALKFLSGVASDSVIWAILSQRGYGQEPHDEGWELLLSATGYRRTPPAAKDSPASRSALAELDALDEPMFRIARAALRRNHAEQCEFVFADLAPATGAGAIVSVATFLDRLDALDHSAERKATRKADHAALAILAARGIGGDERKRLRQLVATAKSAPDPAPETPQLAPNAAQRLEALNAVRAWYEDWSEVAHAVVKRRDQLIRLGLAQRKARKKNKGGSDEGGEK
ncbi:MAG: hypothetical protein MUF54_21885 [Polyangiaceae bacterium]|jgi:hypothetical protein|nr:hypothetical protein [Polyangiaceae bacterium]